MARSTMPLLQDIQYHPVTDKVLHADFLEILPGKKVTIAIPVKVEGVAPGVLQGGKLNKKLRKVKIKGLVEDLPDSFTVNIDQLNIGDSIKVKDVKNDKLEFLDMPGSVIVSVKTARGATAEEEAEDAAAAAKVAEGAEAATAKKKKKAKRKKHSFYFLKFQVQGHFSGNLNFCFRRICNLVT